MLRKFIFAFLALNFLVTSTFAQTHSGLKTAFDEFHYAMTVEWDQKDPEYRNHQTKIFKSEVQRLIGEGLTTEDLQDFITSEVKDKQVSKNLKEAFDFISINRLTPQDAKSHLSRVLVESYSKGANFNGDLSGPGLLVVFILVNLFGILMVVGGAGSSSSSSDGDYDAGYDDGFADGMDFGSCSNC